MSKIAIVFWSGSGNTESMANCIAEGVREVGGEAELYGPGEFPAGQMEAYDVVAFGCPAMGVEVLEESEFEPMFAAVEGTLDGKKVALFGSYGWGDGQWMRDWYQRCQGAGAALYGDEGLTINETPDDAGKEACRELGRGLARW